MNWGVIWMIFIMSSCGWHDDACSSTYACMQQQTGPFTAAACRGVDRLFSFSELQTYLAKAYPLLNSVTCL